jgi:hypothetical protein
MDTVDTERKTIIEQLEILNKQVRRQNSVKQMFVGGVVYGVGFFVGSAILATIAFGIVAPFAGRISWIHNSFVTGSSLRGQ